MMLGFQKVLVIEPHPDDGPLGLGATMARWSLEGRAIMTLMLSDRGEPGWLSEAKSSAAILSSGNLGRPIQVETLHQTCFHMHQERQAILRSFEDYRDTFQPDVVFVPAAGDEHQDHAVALEEARRAFKHVTLLGYEIIRSNRRFRPTLFSTVSASDVAKKAQAVDCYSTQRGKAYTKPRVILGLAAVRGAQCDSPTGLAEAFEVEWCIQKSDWMVSDGCDRIAGGDCVDQSEGDGGVNGSGGGA